MKTLKRPGMRTIKTSLVVAIGLLLSKLLRLEYPYYVAITAIICTQNTLHGSFTMAKNRTLGTIIGSILGIIFVYAFSYSPLTSGIGTLVLIYFLNIIKLEDAFRISCVVYLSTFISSKGSPIMYGVDRTLATIIGILLALGVNLFVSPPQYCNDLKHCSHKLIEKIFKECCDFFVENKKIKILEIGTEILQIEELGTDYKLDVTRCNIDTIDADKLDSIILKAKKIYNHLGIINELWDKEKPLPLDKENREIINYLCNHSFDEDLEEDIHNEENEVFNYHSKEILEELIYLKNLNLKKDLI